jgi:TonB C terminal
MTTPSPELRKLYLRVIRRVHPDGAIDDQDRLRCERLTQQANHAYALGDEAALRAVLQPKPPRPGLRFVLWGNALKIEPSMVVGAAIAVAIVCCYIIIAVRPPKAAHTMQLRTVAQQTQDDTKAPATNIPSLNILDGKPSPQSAFAYRNGNASGRSQAPPGLNRYLDTVSAEIENNFNQHSLDAPDGTSADIAVVIREDGEPEEPHLMMSSGHPAVDSACLRSVEQMHSLGATPTGRKMTVNCQCVVRRR